MYDFTQTNYAYQHYVNNLILRSALRDCKTEEEREAVLKAHQSVSLITILVTFVLALICCGILSIFI